MTRPFVALTLCLLPTLASAQQVQAPAAAAPAAPAPVAAPASVAPATVAPATVAPATAAPGTPAPAAAGQGEFEMSCSYFHHNADGRWNATRPMTLQPAGGPVVLRPTTKFGRGTLFGGFDLAAALDGACPH